MSDKIETPRPQWYPGGEWTAANIEEGGSGYAAIAGNIWNVGRSLFEVLLYIGDQLKEVNGHLDRGRSERG